MMRFPILQAAGQRFKLMDPGPQAADLLVLPMHRRRPFPSAPCHPRIRFAQPIRQCLVFANQSRERADLGIFRSHFLQRRSVGSRGLVLPGLPLANVGPQGGQLFVPLRRQAEKTRLRFPQLWNQQLQFLQPQSLRALLGRLGWQFFL